MLFEYIIVYLASFDKSFGNFTISTTVTSGDKIGNTAALEESRNFRTTMEHVYVCDHFHETQSDNRSFGVVT